MYNGEYAKTPQIIHSKNVDFVAESCLSKAVTKNKSHLPDIRV